MEYRKSKIQMRLVSGFLCSQAERYILTPCAVERAEVIVIIVRHIDLQAVAILGADVFKYLAVYKHTACSNPIDGNNCILVSASAAC